MNFNVCVIILASPSNVVFASGHSNKRGFAVPRCKAGAKYYDKSAIIYKVGNAAAFPDPSAARPRLSYVGYRHCRYCAIGWFRIPNLVT